MVLQDRTNLGYESEEAFCGIHPEDLGPYSPVLVVGALVPVVGAPVPWHAVLWRDVSCYKSSGREMMVGNDLLLDDVYREAEGWLSNRWRVKSTRFCTYIQRKRKAPGFDIVHRTSRKLTLIHDTSLFVATQKDAAGIGYRLLSSFRHADCKRNGKGGDLVMKAVQIGIRAGPNYL
ncbi:hypothetical protein ABKA04_004184 [Annulohypoxylon sp. FPYF3050]